MATDWTDWADGNDLAGMSRATDPLSRAGYDPDEVRANPALREQVMQQVGSLYGLQPRTLTATGPITPSVDIRNASPTPAAPQPIPNAAVKPPTLVPVVAPAKPATSSAPAVTPAPKPAAPTELDSLGREALQKGLSLGNFAQQNAEALANADPGTTALEAQAAKDATPTPYLDPKTGKPLESAKEYEPTGWDKFGRGLKSAAVGFFTGGPFGAAAGAIEPELVRGGTAYDAPNKAYEATEAAREQRLASDQAQIAGLKERFKAMTDARKAANTAAGTAATAFGDVDRGVAGMQPKPEKDGAPQNMLVNGKPSLVTWDPQKGFLDATPGPTFGQPVQGKVEAMPKQATPGKPQAGLINGKPAFAIASPQGWLDGRTGPNYGKPLPPNEAFTPSPTYAETGQFEPVPVYDPSSQTFHPGSFNRRTGTTTVSPQSNAPVTVPTQAMHAIDTDRQAAREADTRLHVMRENERDALNGNQQAMISLVANHIGMTLGQQKGARINQAVWEEAVQSAPWLQRATARFDKEGLLSGVTLSPDQIKQMVELAKQRRDLQWQQAQQTASQWGIPIQVPPDDSENPPDGGAGGKTGTFDWGTHTKPLQRSK